MMRLLTTYMLSAVIIASVLLAGCQSENSNIDNSQGVDIKPSNQQVNIDENTQTDDIILDESKTENQVDGQNQVVSQNQTTDKITADQAKEIAFQHAGVTENDVSFAKVELDYEKGVAEYEVDFYVGTTEYDYEIDAQTGAIISYGKDLGKQTTAQDSTQNYITENQAKEIAFNHAGVTQADISAIKIEVDFDNKIAEFEVEFNVEKTEYEYEINATTGEIISFDKDNN